MRNFLDYNLKGKKISKIIIFNRKLRYEIPSNLNLKISNLIITKIIRRGKYLIVLFKDSDQTLLIHLGMTGYFRLKNKLDNQKHDHVVFLVNKKFLIFNDIRKFGFIKTFTLNKIFNSSHLKNLGVEPLDEQFDYKYFKSNYKRKIDVKGLLMDQSFVAGLGNIYCSEIFFEAKISPLRSSKTLKNIEIHNLINSVKKILKDSINFGGTTIKNFIVSDEKIGYFKNKLNVYSKDKKPCKRCFKLSFIKKIKQNGRSTFYCKNCQK